MNNSLKNNCNFLLIYSCFQRLSAATLQSLFQIIRLICLFIIRINIISIGNLDHLSNRIVSFRTLSNMKPKTKFNIFQPIHIHFIKRLTTIYFHPFQNEQTVLEGYLTCKSKLKTGDIENLEQFSEYSIIILPTLLLQQILFGFVLYWIQNDFPNQLEKYTNYIFQKQIMQSRRGWSQVEDDRLLKIIKKYGTKNWSLISEKLSVGTTFERTGKQCRERWYNHLNPQINTNIWSKEEDEILFEAHRKQGSKWKQISKLFSGRTDNSIKNHFYSTVRKSLRTVSKLKGDKNTTITMKSIKPYVLSKIVQNTELTNLIVTLGRIKSNDTTHLNIHQSVVDQISSELKRISLQYSQKNKQGSELSKQGAQQIKSKSANSIFFEERDVPIQLFPSLKDAVKHYHPQDESMKEYFQEFQSHHNQRQQFILQTGGESKQRGEYHIKDLFATSHHPQSQSGSQFKLDFQLKFPQFQRQMNEESCAYQECQSNFFMSPSTEKKYYFPDLRLLGKVSRNSIPSPACSSKYDDKMANSTASKMVQVRQDPIEIEFDPRDFLNDLEGQSYRVRDDANTKSTA